MPAYVSPDLNTRDYILQTAASRTKNGILTIQEKPAFIALYKSILATRDLLNVEADKYNITLLKTDYNIAVDFLVTTVTGYTTPVPYDDLTGPTKINRTELNAALDNVADLEKQMKAAISAASGISAYLSTPSISITAAADGTVTGATLSAIQVQFIIRSGLKDITTGEGTTYSIVSETGCSFSVNATTGVFTPTSLSADLATATFRAVTSTAYGSVTVDRDIKLNKVKTGGTGVSTAIVYAYKRVASGAAAPTDNPGIVTVSLSGSNAGTIITPSTNALSNGWYKTIPSGTGDLYATAATASGITTTDDIAASEWSSPNILGSTGINGLNTTTVFLYRRSNVSTLPSAPLNTTTYTFSTNTLTGLAGDELNWSRTVPAISGGQYLFVTQATASSATDTDTITSSEWSSVQILAQNGIDGTSGVGTAVVFAYKRVVSGAAAPTDNPGIVTVSLTGATTGTITTPATDALGNGWTKSVPTGSGDLYITAATASSNTGSDSIAANEWSTPNLLGAQGTAGLSTATVYLYRRNNTGVTPSAPSTVTTYTFATDTLTGLSGDGLNWSRSVPNVSNGIYLYVTQATASSNQGSDAINPAEWSAVQILAQNGADGNKNSIAYLYQWSTTQPANPSGTSIYTWATAASSTYTGANGWQTTPPTNVGTASLQLWVASKAVADLSAATTTSVDWTTGFSVKSYTQNGSQGPQGAPGMQGGQAKVYLYAATLPSAPVGTGSYTWATQSFGAAPSGWYLNSASDPNKNTAGYTLWEAKVNISDNASNSTTAFNWNTSTINPVGYNGSNGSPGGQGIQGLSYVTAYCASSTATTTTTPATTTGVNSVPAVNDGGIVGTWSKTVPSLSSGQYLYQSDGIYNPSTNQVTWSIPYWSSLKVGNLSAITTNTGNLQVTGTLTVNTGGLSGATMSGSGAVINSDGTFGFGNSTVNWSTNSNGGSITYDGSNVYFNGNIKSTNAYGVCFRSFPGYTLLSGPDNVVKFARTIPSLLPAVMINDSAADSDAALYISSDTSNAGGSLQVENSYTSGWAMSATSSGSGSGAARFRNSYSSKEVWCGPGTYSIFSPSGGGQAKFTDGIAPFTGIHEALIPKESKLSVGDIVVDLNLVYAKDISNTIFEVEKSTKPNQRGVVGVYNSKVEVSELSPSALHELEEYTVELKDGSTRTDTRIKVVDGVDIEAIKSKFMVMSMNSLGEGMINVCGENGNIKKGDLIVTSSIAGKGMRQDDDIIRSYTVAKARCDVNFTVDSYIQKIPCIYLCG